MTPGQFDGLDGTTYGKVLPDGTPVISLMTDPSGAYGPDSGADLFVSVVPKGANGLRWAAIKADTTPTAAPLHVRAWRALSAALSDTPATAAKGDDPVTFEAAMFPRLFFSSLWDAQDAMRDAIRGIMEDEATIDKPGAIGKVLDSFKAYVMQAAVPMMAIKTADLPIIRQGSAAIADPDPLAAKIGKVISTANAGKIRAANERIRMATAELDALLAETGNGDPAEAAKSEEDPMKFGSVLAALTLAIKSADPKLSEGDALDRALPLAMQAIKAAPGEPDNDLQRLITESGLGSGGPTTEALAAAVMRLPAMKAFGDRLTALEAAINGTPAAKTAAGEDVAAVPGLSTIVETALELAVKASGALKVPAAPASGGDPDAARTAANRAAAEKSDDDIFKGSGLSILNPS